MQGYPKTRRCFGRKYKPREISVNVLNVAAEPFQKITHALLISGPIPKHPQGWLSSAVALVLFWAGRPGTTEDLQRV